MSGMIETMEPQEGLHSRTVPVSAGVMYRRLEVFAGQLAKAGDTRNQARAEQLLDKLRKKEYTVAFCGHFSAGKSSMINALMGSEVLPSSPIPTSANVVKIKTGKKGARIIMKDGSAIDFGEDYDLTELKKYAVNGNEVETIEVYHPSNLLNMPISIMDTPGIDSTDDAHKVSTESSLHLSDAVLYVMDYNHVQSEVNFQFTKTLKDWGKPVYLVINQIDKHVDFELSFEQYRRSVEEAFSHWDIKPDGIYFTSLKDAAHPENEWQELLAKLGDMFSQKESLLVPSVMNSAMYLVEEHRKFLREQTAEEQAECERILQASGIENVPEVYRTLTERLASIQAPARLMEEEAKQELQNILDNAPLVPFATRELARLFLESRQPGFKVGFLFSSGKTKEEQSNRLAALYEDLCEKASAHLEWHSKELLRKLPEKYGYDDTAYQQRVMDMTVAFSPELLTDTVKPGAVTNGEYILNYAKDVADKIKSLYRRAALTIVDEAVHAIREKSLHEEKEIKRELAAMEKEKAAYEAISSLQEQEQSALRRLTLTLTEGIAGEEAASLPGYEEEPVERLEKSAPVLSRTASARKGIVMERQEEGRRDVNASYSSAINKDYRGHLLKASSLLRSGSAMIKEVPGLAGASAAMHARAERLEQNRFTVALFGAFSAGKSSFANSLMGDLILPVSPNPTTAAINKILPPDDNNPHGSVRVRLKNHKDVTDDVIQSLEVFELTGQTVQDAISEAQKIDPKEIHPAAKPHYSFLRAVQRGYAAIEEQLGQDLIVGLKEFQEFVAQEEKACFVEWIELYYDCPLTQQGIILVDTPGADSINARHTGVAFEYIKNADAVLFVTYYNHAFSHADREFLIQLGRVKDTFAMDKMFFIVNAADLAHSQEELDGVIDHVKQNLATCGIAQPRIYPVSSQTALLARMEERGRLSASAEQIYRKRLGISESDKLPHTERALRFSGLHYFEEQFIAFTLDELTQMAMRSAFAEVSRTLDTLKELIAAAHQDSETRSRQLKKAQREQENALEAIRLLDAQVEIQTLENEIKELVYYVRQRVMLRFSEGFRHSFNPSTLQNDGRSIQKMLSASLDELSRFFAFDLAQEMRATALRVEKFMARTGNKLIEKMNARMAVEQFELRPWEQPAYETPEFSSAFPAGSTSELKGPLSLFKNPRHFFEQGGQDKMREELEHRYQVPVQAYVDNSQQRLHAFYVPAFTDRVHAEKIRAANEVQEHFAGLLAVLGTQIDIDGLQSIREELVLQLSRTIEETKFS